MSFPAPVTSVEKPVFTPPLPPLKAKSQKNKSLPPDPKSSEVAQMILREPGDRTSSNLENPQGSISTIPLPDLLAELRQRIDSTFPNGSILSYEIPKAQGKLEGPSEKKKILDSAPDLEKSITELASELTELMQKGENNYHQVIDVLKNPKDAKEHTYQTFIETLNRHLNELTVKKKRIEEHKEHYVQVLTALGKKIEKSNATPLTKEEISNAAKNVGMNREEYQKRIGATKAKREGFILQKNSLIQIWNKILRDEWIIKEQLHLEETALDTIPHIKIHSEESERFSSDVHNLKEQVWKLSLEVLNGSKKETSFEKDLTEKLSDLNGRFVELEKKFSSSKIMFDKKISAMKDRVSSEALSMQGTFVELERFPQESVELIKEEIIEIQKKYNGDRLILRDELMKDWGNICIQYNFLKIDLKIIKDILDFIPQLDPLTKTLGETYDLLRNKRKSISPAPEVLKPLINEAAVKYDPLVKLYQTIQEILDGWKSQKGWNGVTFWSGLKDKKNEHVFQDLISYLSSETQGELDNALRLQSKKLVEELNEIIDTLCASAALHLTLITEKFNTTALEFALAIYAYKNGAYPTKMWIATLKKTGYSNTHTSDPTDPKFNIKEAGYLLFLDKDKESSGSPKPK
jgi:hypothetical protein